MMQERFLNQLQANTALSSILRHSGRGRIGARYAIHTVPQRYHWNTWGRSESGNNASPVVNSGFRLKGKQLLDHEALSCLLVLLFADEPKLNTLRLHRVIRNLCYHGPTREWIVKALLSIIDRSVNMKSDLDVSNNKTPKKAYRPGPLSVKLTTDAKTHNNSAAWLNIKMDAALGCRANVFIVHRNYLGKRNERQGANSVNVHPQAAPVVCRHALDLFISLAKNFPSFFLPSKKSKEEENEKETNKNKNLSPVKNNKVQDSSDFWDMLLKLDSLNATKKGKSVAKMHTYSNTTADSDTSSFTFETSTFGQLLNMLSSKVITRSAQLTDKLLRLLSLITLGLPEFPVGLPAVSNTKSRNKYDSSISSIEESLQLVVNVITSKSCSEEGLEDAAALLFNIANCSEEMRHMVLFLMLNGALKLSVDISSQINNLLEELKTINMQESAATYMSEVKESSYVSIPQPSSSSASAANATPSQSTSATSSSDKPSKGTICDRFTRESVVIIASAKVKQTCDLQLPSMAPLTTKTSSQAFFLRLLRLIAQIHETLKKNNKINFEVHEDAPTDVEDSGDKTDVTETTKEPFKYLNLPPGMDFEADVDKEIPSLSEMMSLGKLWHTLSQCLLELEHTPDHHAVLVLQPTVEAFFLVHSPAKQTTPETTTEAEQPMESQEEAVNTLGAPLQQDNQPKTINLPPDQQKFLQFAERHRTVLNQILRQTTSHLADGPFSVLVDHTRILDFDVKRKYFRTELERLDNGTRREETAVHVRRSHIFEDSFRELYRRTPEEWKNRFYIVFEGI